MDARRFERAFGADSSRWVVFALVAAALTLWIFARPSGPSRGPEWLEVHEFHKHHYREAILAGRLPLWNPHLALGRPFLADIETATLYPPNLLFILPGAWALPLSVGFHLGLILVGAALLGHALELGRGRSLLAGVSFALSAAVCGRLQSGEIQVFCTLAHLPLWWGWAIRTWREPTARNVVVFAVITASAVYAGSPRFLAAMALALGTWLLVWGAGDLRRKFWRGFVGVATGGMVGLVLASAQLLPFIELCQQASVTLTEPDVAAQGPLSWHNIASLVLPTSDKLAFPSGMNFFTGLLAPGGVVFAIVAWRDPVARAFAVVAVVGVVFALFPPDPFVAWLAGWLPGVGAFGVPSRNAFVVGWALLMVVLVGWDRKMFAQAPWIPVAAAAVQVASLLWAVHAQAAQYASARIPLAEASTGEEVRRVAAQTAPLATRTALPRDLVRPNAGELYGFSNLESSAHRRLARVWETMSDLAGVEAPSGVTGNTANLALQPRADLVRWGVQFGWDIDRQGLFFEPQASPRAQAVYSVAVAANRAEAARGWWTTRDNVWLEAPTEIAPAELVPPPNTLGITRAESEMIEVAWKSSAPGWLVLAEPWYPGWVAVTAQRVRQIQPVNGWMRGVPMPAGHHAVVFEYRPATVMWGAIVSCLGLVGTCGAVSIRRRSRLRNWRR